MKTLLNLITLHASLWLLHQSAQGAPLSVDELINLAIGQNPGIAAAQQDTLAADATIKSFSALSDPIFGIKALDRDAETRYATITQKVSFPYKATLKERIQASQTDASRAKLNSKKLMIRQKVISLYYAIYATQKIIQLTQANRQTLREFARIAEKKYGAGESSQADAMKAHFELTKLDLELIRLDDEEQALKEDLQAIVNQPSLKLNLSLGHLNLPVPRVDLSRLPKTPAALESLVSKTSPVINRETHRLTAAEKMNSLSHWHHAPDFHFQYQHRISGKPENSKIYSIGMSLPIWLGQHIARSDTAAAKHQAQKFRLQDTRNQTLAQVKQLISKVRMQTKSLSIYETSLIPQALGAFNSNRSAYQSSSTSLLNLLDSQRSLFRVRGSYYQTIKHFSQDFSRLETALGFPLTSIISATPINPVKKETSP